jgi:hypothetical protein
MTYDEKVKAGCSAALMEAERFLMRRIADRLDKIGVDYAVAGGMALVAHGHNRTTVDVDIVVNSAGLKKLHEELSGLGYVEPFSGSKNLSDTISKVRIEFLVAGQFPGDGKPKPVAFPEPKAVATEIDGIKYLNLVSLIELKLASGLTGGVVRLKDFADVVELIRLLRLGEDFAQKLDPYVRPKFQELLRGIPPNDE